MQDIFGNRKFCTDGSSWLDDVEVGWLDNVEIGWETEYSVYWGDKDGGEQEAYKLESADYKISIYVFEGVARNLPWSHSCSNFSRTSIEVWIRITIYPLRTLAPCTTASYR